MLTATLSGAASPGVPRFFHLCCRSVTVAAATHHTHRVTKDSATAPRLSPPLVQRQPVAAEQEEVDVEDGGGVEAKLRVSAVPRVQTEALERQPGLAEPRCSQSHVAGKPGPLRFPPQRRLPAAESTGSRHVLVDPAWSRTK